MSGTARGVVGNSLQIDAAIAAIMKEERETGERKTGGRRTGERRTMVRRRGMAAAGERARTALQTVIATTTEGEGAAPLSPRMRPMRTGKPSHFMQICRHHLCKSFREA